MDVSWSDVIDDWCSGDISQEHDVTPFDLTSNEDDKSSSQRSGSLASRRTTKSRQRSSTNLSVMSQSDGSSYSRFSQNEQVPSAQSEGRILDLLAGSGYPMTQVNGQRKLGPPPGWTDPPPEPDCEIFVGKIPRDLHEDTLYPIFSRVGEIYEIRLMMDFSGTNRGYCFIMFTKVEYAKRAIRELNNWEIRHGHKIGVVASINYCRLCIGQLPADIKSETVINTFHDLTEDVSKVSVYRHMNGQVRFALVWYRTHRGAAMARRRLLPERTTLFENVEVNIDWAHPEMTPNNVIEESGTRDANGVIQITRREIGVHPKRAGSQRRGRDDFLDKSIKNYLQDKNMKKNASTQRNKCSETSGRLEKPTRCVGVFAGKQKSQKTRSAHQKQWNDVRGDCNKENMISDRDTGLPNLSNWQQERCGVSGGENKSPWYLKNRDINGNVECLQNGRAIGWENSEKRTVASDGRGFGVMANSFSSQKPPDSKVYGNHSNVEQIPRAFCGYNSVPNNFHAFKSLAEILEMQRSMSLNGQLISVENCGPLKIGSPNCFRENVRQLVNFIPNSNESKNRSSNFLAPNEIANYHGNLGTNQEDPRVVGNLTKNFRNIETSKENNFYGNHKVHGDQSFCHDCQDQARFFMECFQFQRSMPVYRHGTHVFDNYFRGSNGRSAHQLKDNQQTSFFPFDKIVPSNSYSTSSFAGYRPGPGHPETAHPRSILG